MNYWQYNIRVSEHTDEHGNWEGDEREISHDALRELLGAPLDTIDVDDPSIFSDEGEDASYWEAQTRSGEWVCGWVYLIESPDGPSHASCEDARATTPTTQQHTRETGDRR